MQAIRNQITLIKGYKLKSGQSLTSESSDIVAIKA